MYMYNTTLKIVLYYGLQVQPVKWPLTLHWRKVEDLVPGNLPEGSVAVIDGKMFCGGSREMFHNVKQYDSKSGKWSLLQKAPVRDFCMTSLNGQLLLAGGGDSDGNDVNTIAVWDSDRGEWVHPYPPMPTRRSQSAAVGYQNYLIVACGWLTMDIVEVLDSSSGRWYSAQPVPVGGRLMTTAVVGDCWYLSSFEKWKDDKEHIFWTHLPTLISSATSVFANAASVWHELSTPPVERPALLGLQGHLLLVGGGGYKQDLHSLYRYDPETKQWIECGHLPVGMNAPCCAVLPSGELMVAGANTELPRAVWIGSIGG